MGQEMATLPVEYIPQHKMPSASISGSPDFIECAQCCRMVDSVPVGHTISIQPIPSVDAGEMMMPAQELGTLVAQGLGLTPLIGGHRDTVPIVSPLLQTKISVKKVLKILTTMLIIPKINHGSMNPAFFWITPYSMEPFIKMLLAEETICTTNAHGTKLLRISNLFQISLYCSISSSVFRVSSCE